MMFFKKKPKLNYEDSTVDRELTSIVMDYSLKAESIVRTMEFFKRSGLPDTTQRLAKLQHKFVEYESRIKTLRIIQEELRAMQNVEWVTNFSSNQLYEKCKELIGDRLVDGEIKAKSRTVIEMTPEEWLEEIIYHYGNRSMITDPISLCCDLFILLDKLKKE